MSNHYQLDKVIMLSRHGIRTQLPSAIKFIKQATSLTWPAWIEKEGYLTTRGGVLEAYFGAYFSDWLTKQGLIISDFNEELFAYANSLQRTVATAQFFMAGAFPGQDITIHHKHPIEKMDAFFGLTLRDDSEAFKQQISNILTSSYLNQNLQESYSLLSSILDYQHSDLFKQWQCDFHKIPTKLILENGKEPFVSGPLTIATAIVDTFVLQHYSGFAIHDVAWGKITNHETWKKLLAIRNQYISAIYGTEPLATHLAEPLIRFIDDLIHEQHHKLIYLVGHDSNIASLLRTLSFELKPLNEQFEQTPIGGKVLFKRFYNNKNGTYFFKADYIYQSYEQLRTGFPLDENNQPQVMPLKFGQAQINSDGFYQWSDFLNRLKSYRL